MNHFICEYHKKQRPEVVEHCRGV